MWPCFYDDFISFSQPRLFQSTEMTISPLFKLLGWIFAEEGEKCVPFSEVCDGAGRFFQFDPLWQRPCFSLQHAGESRGVVL